MTQDMLMHNLRDHQLKTTPEDKIPPSVRRTTILYTLPSHKKFQILNWSKKLSHHIRNKFIKRNRALRVFWKKMKEMHSRWWAQLSHHFNYKLIRKLTNKLGRMLDSYSRLRRKQLPKLNRQNLLKRKQPNQPRLLPHPLSQLPPQWRLLLLNPSPSRWAAPK